LAKKWSKNGQKWSKFGQKLVKNWSKIGQKMVKNTGLLWPETWNQLENLVSLLSV
jgi:hypothetical protein